MCKILVHQLNVEPTSQMFDWTRSILDARYFSKNCFCFKLRLSLAKAVYRVALCVNDISKVSNLDVFCRDVSISIYMMLWFCILVQVTIYTWRQVSSLSPGVPGSNPAVADIFPWCTHMQ